MDHPLGQGRAGSIPLVSLGGQRPREQLLISEDAAGFEVRGLRIGPDTFHICAGPCAVESREQIETIFQSLAALGIPLARAGAYKPRTSPYDFPGLGAPCLPYVFEAAGRHGLHAVVLEVLSERHIDEVRRAVEATGGVAGAILQIGTRNAQNFDLLRAAGRQQDFPVLYKRGMGITLRESLLAAEYIACEGNRRIIFCLRGVKTCLGDPHRNLVDFALVPVVRRETRLAICVDPSHAVGQRHPGRDGLDDISHAAAQGVIAGANLLMLEVHPEPSRALCDGQQAIGLGEMESLVEDAMLVRRAYLGRLHTLDPEGSPGRSRLYSDLAKPRFP